jgi:hypothetical protein
VPIAGRKTSSLGIEEDDIDLGKSDRGVVNMFPPPPPPPLEINEPGDAGVPGLEFGKRDSSSKFCFVSLTISAAYLSLCDFLPPDKMLLFLILSIFCFGLPILEVIFFFSSVFVFVFFFFAFFFVLFFFSFFEVRNRDSTSQKKKL